MSTRVYVLEYDSGDIDAGNGGGDDFSLPDSVDAVSVGIAIVLLPSTCVPVFDVVIGFKYSSTK